MVLDFSLTIIHTDTDTFQISILDPGLHPDHSVHSPLLMLFNNHSLNRSLVFCGVTSQVLCLVFYTNPRANSVALIVFDSDIIF